MFAHMHIFSVILVIFRWVKRHGGRLRLNPDWSNMYISLPRLRPLITTAQTLAGNAHDQRSYPGYICIFWIVGGSGDTSFIFIHSSLWSNMKTWKMNLSVGLNVVLQSSSLQPFLRLSSCCSLCSPSSLHSTTSRGLSSTSATATSSLSLWLVVKSSLSV